MKPEFIDNRGENTLVAALKAHIEWLSQTYTNPVGLSVATGYFDPDGFGMVADALERLTNVRLLLGAEPPPLPAKHRRMPGEPHGERFDAERVEKALKAHADGLKTDCDLLGFTPEVDATLRRLLEFLRSGRIDVRRYEKAFLHGKAYIFATDEGVIAGSSNFTAGGLVGNLELNLGRYDPTPVRQVKAWFDDLWEEAVPFDLAAIYEARYLEYDPHLIYLRVLWELFGEELEEEQEGAPQIWLTTFQNDGLFRAKRILDRYHGVLIADGVGLGKTFVAGAVLQEAVQERRQRALLICPAALRDGTWERFAARHQLYLKKISYENLADEKQLGGEQSYLEDIDRYALIVIDEAQAFRNPDTKRARALRRLLRGTPPKKLVLLSATPVNNSLWDLYYLLLYFVRHDATFADRGIPSLKRRFEDAAGEDPFELRPDVLFDVLDATTVRRTRHFVKKYYPGERIPSEDGILIRFPDPHVHKVGYELDDVLPGFFEEFAEALAPESGEPQLTLSRYWPSAYRLVGPPEAREVALVGMLRSGLLKRFESSAYAFARTTAKMAAANEAFLAALDQGYIATPEAMDEWAEVDSDEAFAELLREGGAEPVEGYDVERLRRDVERDRDLLRAFSERAATVTREEDPKVSVLVESLAAIATQAEKETLDDEDFRGKRKVIVFSYYEDTLNWIEEHLLDVLDGDRRLACYRGRLASVSGTEARRGVSRDAAVFGFAPKTTEAPPGRDDDRFDILLSTDVLAEGQNLQQCRNLINYDLPWNPMRLVQRHGRIDRIGSPHSDVYVRCIFPDRRLDELLELEARVRRKLAQAAATIGVESEVIPAGATSEVVFAETREEIEKLRQENPTIFVNAGEDPAAHSGEEYRQDLRKGLQEREAEIKGLPWAAGSGFAGGSRRGYFFCAKVGDRPFLRFVPWDGEEILKDTLACLKQINCESDTERVVPGELLGGIYEAWARARQNIYDEWMFATDPANLQPKIRPLFHRIAEHLRKHPPPDLEQGALEEILEAVEAPWGARIERELRTVFDPEAEDPARVSAELVEKVHELGLEPYVPPKPLPVIDQDDIALVCWMIIDSGGDGRSKDIN